MKVIKRDGRTESFEIDKIVRTIEYASDETGEPLTASDIELLSEDIRDRVGNREDDKISIAEIQDIILEQLNNNGFNNIADHYKDYLNG